MPLTLVKTCSSPGAGPDAPVFTGPLRFQADGIQLLGQLAFVNALIMALIIHMYLFSPMSVCCTELSAAARSC